MYKLYVKKIDPLLEYCDYGVMYSYHSLALNTVQEISAFFWCMKRVTNAGFRRKNDRPQIKKLMFTHKQHKAKNAFGYKAVEWVS